jgi:hypothetical protein
MVDKRFTLTPDTKGALTSGLFHGSALILSGILSYGYISRHQTSSLWFYLFFFAFWFILFSGFTSIVSQCLLLMPRSLNSIRISSNALILEWKNGDTDELVRKIQFQGSRTILGIWGQTVDKRRVQATIRRNSLSREEMQELLADLERLKELEKRIS